MNYDYAVHSDILLHWTGKDLDCKLQPKWYNEDKSDTRKNTSLEDEYLKRLYNILKYGIWVTEEPSFVINLRKEKPMTIPVANRACFTELKLSQSRKHARDYGRLGIGMKRPFVFEREGRPLVYFGYERVVEHDVFFKECVENFENKSLLQFFKPMNKTQVLNYDYYSESEWRIIESQSLITNGKLIDPRDPKNAQENSYFKKLSSVEQGVLKYLLPVDGWLSLIILPSISVKNKLNDPKNEIGFAIKNEMRRIKETPCPANRVENGVLPIEIDIDACRNF